MIKILIAFTLIAFYAPLQAQKEEEPFTYVPNMPSFPGGMDTINAYIKSHLIYPMEARKNKIKGQVIVEFIVHKDGSTSNAKLKTGIGFGCDEEAIRIVDAMNQSYHWTPGSYMGLNRPVILAIPVMFKYHK